MAFITNFRIAEIDIYREAVNTWPDGKDFAVSNKDNRKVKGETGSLHYFGHAEELGPFWAHFDEVRKRMGQ